MSRKRGGWAIAVGVALGLRSALGAAEPNWQPWPDAVPPPRPAAGAASALSLGRPTPVAGLDRPVPLPQADPGLSPVAFQGNNGLLPPPAGPVVRGQAPQEPAPALGGLPPVGPGPTITTTGAATTTPFNPAGGAPATTTSGTGGPPPGALPGTPDYNAGAVIDRPLTHPWGDRLREWCGLGHGGFTFRSDHCFDDVGLVSPLTNPFFFEDPRSLTEVRPIYIYQSIPRHTPIVAGGDVQFFGLQGRLALGENLSIVVNELGLVRLHSGHPEDDPDGRFGRTETGFAELQIGPKWAFFRGAAPRT